jgi:hypothetical protein
MRPGYLGNCGENSRQLGYVENIYDPLIYEVPPLHPQYPITTGYIPDYMKYSKIFPNLPVVYPRRLALRSPRTFNVLMV